MVSFVAVPVVECNRITFLLKPSMALYENIKTVQNSGPGLDWPGFLGAKISETYYRMHDSIPGAEAKEPICPTTCNSSFQTRH